VGDISERYVTPFYLDMMGLNAPTSGAERLATIRTLAGELDAQEVVGLLRSDWRPRVMGAWYALFNDAASVGDELLHSLETALGSLTAPALAIAASEVLGRDAVPSLEIYASADMAANYGSAGFVAAVIERLDADPTRLKPGDQDRESVASMLAVAARLRVA